MVVADHDITALLGAWRGGDEQAGKQVVEHLHSEIRRIAGILMSRERSDHTLQPTALVSELYLRLIKGTPSFNDRSHFLAVATQHLRWTLVDHARRKLTKRRAAVNVPLDGFLDRGGAVTHHEIVTVDEALLDLAHEHQRVARVMELRYFGGLQTAEVAAALGVSEPSVKRDSAFGRAWIGEYLTRTNFEGKAQSGS